MTSDDTKVDTSGWVKGGSSRIHAGSAFGCITVDGFKDNAAVRDALWDAIQSLPKVTAERDRLRDACSRQNADISQTLGKALGYPWFKDDQKNFPGSTDEHGVCVGDHVAESLADEAAAKVSALSARVKELTDLIGEIREDVFWSPHIEQRVRALIGKEPSK